MDNLAIMRSSSINEAVDSVAACKVDIIRRDSEGKGL